MIDIQNYLLIPDEYSHAIQAADQRMEYDDEDDSMAGLAKLHDNGQSHGSEFVKTEFVVVTAQKDNGVRTDPWPISLHLYADLCFAECSTSFDRDVIEIHLRRVTHDAMLSGVLQTKDWLSEPVPRIPSSDSQQ